MRWSHVLLSLMLVLLLACGKEEAPPPPIPYDTLEEVLAEILILEPAGREFPYAVQDSLYDHYYGIILGQRGYTKEDFITAMQQLQADPKQLEEVYTKVLEKIQVIETEANK